ncbi:MAG: glycoside hydrolase family 2 protein [Muribaculaceae bacterium]|nr:glycoside hydrolase family 2 protein [Muribaculaceae bacterium]
MRKAAVLLILTSCAIASAGAETGNINSDWEFQLVTTASSANEIANQGTDWSSQFNIEHVDRPDSPLIPSERDLIMEAQMLDNGEWKTVDLPHNPVVEDLVVLHQWQGICYYRKRLDIDSKDAGKRLWLEFEGAMHLADVWINGTHAGNHSGGYTPFVIDATGLLKAGEPNEITVRLDNRDNRLIPPGKPLESLDFCYYGGLYRDVNLITKNPVYITHPIMADKVAGGGIFVSYPTVGEELATVNVAVDIANTAGSAADLTVSHTLYEWKKGAGKGRKVASAKSGITIAAGLSERTETSLDVKSPRLWSPDSPSLYLLETEVRQGGRLVDRELTRIGIRHIEITKAEGFKINGRPMQLTGTNRHMEYPYVGNAISDNAQFRDIHQIKANGFNVVRLGHYPQDPSVLDACDELGLLAIEPIPGWQFFNKSRLFIDHTYKDIRDMIRRDRNHPSIIVWETTLNESWPPAEWKDGAVKVAHEEYPGNQCYTAGDSYGYDGFDVCYNDWEEGFNRPNHTSKPGFIREYYDYEFGGHYSTTRIRRGDGDRALSGNLWNAQWSCNRYNAYYPATFGAAVWSMYDYNRGCCDNICYSGVADIFRLPKFSLEFFRSQIKAGTPLMPGVEMPHMVFVAGHWLEQSSDTVVVLGNVDEVELQLNGVTIGRRSHDYGPDTHYVPAADGGNCRNLPSAPFTFTGVEWQRGELKAIGYAGGRKVAEHSVSTPGETASLAIDYFEEGKPAAKNDLLIVYVRLKDAAGTEVFGENSRRVTLHASGGTIVGPSTRSAEAGVASFLVRTGNAGKLRLHAASGPLSSERNIKLAGKNAF